MQILFDANNPRFSRPLHHTRHDDRSKNAKNHDDDENLDEGEANNGDIGRTTT